MLHVLAIGNSFSEDATTYLAEIAAASGCKMVVGNLYIGGCSLDLHDKNAREDACAYSYTKTDAQPRMISIREALEEEQWDFVTMQQASHLSGIYSIYQPYLAILRFLLYQSYPP